MRIHYYMKIACCFSLISVLTGQEINWTTKSPLPLSIRNGSAAACNGKVYFMGGYCNETPERFEVNNFEYTPKTDSWKKRAPLPTGRSNFTLVSYDGKIYAIGGDPFSGKNERYDPQTNTWTTLAPMPTPRQHLYGTVLNGKIYMIGGLQKKEDASLPKDWSYENISVKNEVYDIVSDTWQELSPMPIPRHDSRTVAFDGRIYVMGGMGEENNIWKGLSVVEMYDPKTNSWEKKASLPESRDGFGMSVIQDKIYIIGGFSNDEVVNTVLVYDPDLDEWSVTTNIPNNHNGSAGVATIDNRIYVIGGCDVKYKPYDNTIVGVINPVNTIDYLGQTPPGDNPIVFAPGIVSTLQHEHSAPAFTPDGKEVYWSMIRKSNDSTYQHIMYSEYKNDSWTTPRLAPFSSYKFYEGGPVISSDGKKLYIYRGLAARPGGDARVINIICYTREGNEWVNPVNLCEGVFHSVTKTGTIYYTSIKNGISRSVYKNNSYSEPEILNDQINLPGTMNWTPFIAPDESYLIFSRVIEGGDYGNLFIAFHDTANDTWSQPIMLNEKINSWSQERFPTVSPDGNYLFFNRWISEMNDDVFWVSSACIDSLKQVSINSGDKNQK